MTPQIELGSLLNMRERETHRILAFDTISYDRCGENKEVHLERFAGARAFLSPEYIIHQTLRRRSDFHDSVIVTNLNKSNFNHSLELIS